MTSVKEDSGQQSCTTKELEKSGEVDNAQRSSSTKELNESGEVDTSQQVLEDEITEKKDDKEDVREKLVRGEVPTEERWLSWWKKQRKRATTLKQMYS